VMMGVNDSRWYGVLETAAKKSGGWRGRLARLRVWKLARYVRYELLRAAAPAASRPRPPRAPSLARECSRLLADRAADGLIEKACQRAVAADPEDRASHYNLVELYRARRRYGEAERLLRRAAALAPEAEWHRVPLAEILILQDEKPEAEKLLLAVLSRSSDPAMVNRVLMSLDGIYRERGQPERIGEAYRRVVAFETRGAGAIETAAVSSEGSPEGLSAVTAVNYHRLREMLRARGVRLVAVQYPTLSGDGLRALFRQPEGVLFVENRENFRKALKEGGYARVFRDRAFGGWGHCTPEGDRLIAKAVARVLSSAP